MTFISRQRIQMVSVLCVSCFHCRLWFFPLSSGTTHPTDGHSAPHHAELCPVHHSQHGEEGVPNVRQSCFPTHDHDWNVKSTHHVSEAIQQSEKFLDLGTVTRPPSNIYARVNCSVIRYRCTRVQGHPRNLFRRPMDFRAFVAKASHLTMPRQRTLVYGGKLLFSNAAAKVPKAISQKRHDGFSFLNDENLDKCLSKKKIRLTTPALWLSSPH